MDLYRMCFEAYEKRYLWDYYEGIETNPLINPDNAEKFIKEMFGQGFKESIFIIDSECATDMTMERAEHMVRVYFIGIYFQSLIDDSLHINSQYGWYPFGYIWYLCCLYHDMGYLYENKINNEGLETLKELNTRRFWNERLCYYKSLGIKIDIAVPNFPFSWHCYHPQRRFLIKEEKKKKGLNQDNRTVFCDKRCKDNIEYNNGTVIKRNYCTNRDRNAYLKYKMFERSKEKIDVDHGIVGGDLLFAQLVKNYKQHYMRESKNQKIDFYDFRVWHKGKQRHFSCEQFKILAHIADCISYHNIFKANDETELLYLKYGLENFIGNRYKRISYQDNPLLFILCLADAIEPTKKFPKEQAQIVLRSINVNYDHSTKHLNIEIKPELRNRCKKETEKYLDSLRSLEGYMDLQVTV